MVVLEKVEMEEKYWRTSSSGVNSLTMLKSLYISSEVLPFIMFAMVLHASSLCHIRFISSHGRKNGDVSLCLLKRSDIQVISGDNNLEKHFLIDSYERLVPGADIRCAFSSVVLVYRLAPVVLTVDKDLRDRGM